MLCGKGFIITKPSLCYVMCACSVMSNSLWSSGCCPRGSSVHGILQARILEWVVIPFSGGSFWPRDRTHISCVSCLGRWILYHCPTWKASVTRKNCLKMKTGPSQLPCKLNTVIEKAGWFLQETKQVGTPLPPPRGSSVLKMRKHPFCII